MNLAFLDKIGVEPVQKREVPHGKVDSVRTRGRVYNPIALKAASMAVLGAPCDWSGKRTPGCVRRQSQDTLGTVTAMWRGVSRGSGFMSR